MLSGLDAAATWHSLKLAHGVLIYGRNSFVSDSLSGHGVSTEVSGLTPRGNLQRVRKRGLPL
jgi:hypothetical protein